MCVQLGHVAEAEAAFKKALSLDDPRSPGIHAMRVLAQMKQGLGDHWAAIRVLSKAIDLDNNPERIQCLFLRGDWPLACTSLHVSRKRQSMWKPFVSKWVRVFLNQHIGVNRYICFQRNNAHMATAAACGCPSGAHVRAMHGLLCLVM